MADELGPDAQEPQKDENMVLDLSQTDDSLPSFEPLPQGVYNCEVEETEYGMSKSGNPMITWQFRVVDSEFENRLLFYHTVLNKEAGLARLKRALVRIAPDVDLTKLDVPKFCEEGVIVGRPCRVKVRTRRRKNNEKSNDVTDVLAPEGEGDFLDDVQ